MATERREVQPTNAESRIPKGWLRLWGQLGKCGDRDVFLGFASGAILSRLSFADVLDEATGAGYQRRFCKDHSLAFKRYIQAPGSATIPLTFNLRVNQPARWVLEGPRSADSMAALAVNAEGPPALAQVDCQHRLGYLRESPIPFAFMAFVGLSVEEEMAIFRDINGKAKGLSSSLLDYTAAKMAQEDLAEAHPAIALALHLQEDPVSPWQHRLDLGGERTNGMKRMASLRTMQKAIRRFQREAKAEHDSVDALSQVLVDFWRAVVRVYPEEWQQSRRHLISKGIGVYSLMSLAGVLLAEARATKRRADQDYFVERLSDFAHHLDWTNSGPMQGFGGAAGADRAFEMIMAVRHRVLKELHGKQEHPAH
jgi:DNA sulfur modification protein DndB